MRHSPLRHNLARLRQSLNLHQQEMADLAGCSRRAIQSVELGTLALSESLACRITSKTGVDVRWLLENDLKADIVNSRGRVYSKSDYECAQANKTIGLEFVQFMIGDYAASFYGQIRAILSSAVKRNLAEIATWRIAKFLDDCRHDFGHDKQLIGSEEQFGLRADDSPYLKRRQVTAGINLFRKYYRDRKQSIAHDLALLKKAAQFEARQKRQRSSAPSCRRKRKRAS
jgi:transcriptional regulator with XRE-family HTH domain